MKIRFPLAVLLLLSSCALSPGQTFDTLVFGNTASEGSHAMVASFPPPTDITTTYWQNNTPPPSNPSASAPSDVVAGGAGLSARRLLPRTPNGDAYGGQISFTMAVDPLKQNYFSAKLWAPDAGSGFLVLNCNGKEIGNRHGGGGLTEDPFWSQGTGWYGNRFFYRTEPLPLAMTRGHTSVTITIRSLGSMYFYAPIFTYVPQYQHIMNAPSLALYTAYTHAGAIPDTTGEAQGTAPTVLTPRALENEANTIASTKANVNSSLASKLAATPSTLSKTDASFLAQCYDAKTNYGASWITYPAGKTAADLGNQIIAILDALVTSYGTDTTVATNGWGGGLGDMGDAVRLAWPLLSSAMPTTVAYGGTLGTVTRQAGWSAALRASVDGGRTHRLTIANQDIACSWAIYRANRGLLLVNAANALNEAEAARYFKESCGILPWMGNDQATGGTDGSGGGPVPTRGTMPYGPNWYMCTSKGTTKDGEGFVGSDYGELGSWIYKMGLLAGDSQIQARGLLMTRARCQFRYPSLDDEGYLVMMGTDPIGVRNNDLPSHFAYLGRGYGDDLLMASRGAAAIGSDLLGYFQQAMNDGQLVRSVFSTDPYIPDRWAAFRAMAQTGVKLPTSSGQPDYAWADEENMVVAAKHGEERFYANLYWRQPAFINGLAKVFHLTPTTANLADVMVDDVRFRPTGNFFLTASNVDNFTSPPDNPQEAFGGLSAPIAWRSDLTSVPATNRDAGRGTGYTLRYGNWLVGINADYNATYNVLMPSDFTSATDLISGSVMSGPVVLAPKTSVVFYLPANVDPNPPPARSLVVSAVGGNGAVTVGWYAAGAASSYQLLRSTVAGGPYTQIASGLTGTSYTDTSVTNGTAYYYVVQSVNAAGLTSGNSPETTATPRAAQTAGLSAPWGDLDMGASTGGNASLAGGTLTMKSGPGDVWGTNDGCHFAYQALLGDGVFTARVQSQSSTNGYAKAGLMIRSSLSADAVRAAIFLQPSKRAEFDFRSTTGGGTGNQTLALTYATPGWVRLVRVGGLITAFVSPDGVAWTQVGSTSLGGLPYAAYIGLAIAPANGSAGQTNTGVFTNLTLPLGATSAPGVPAGLTVAAGDNRATLGWTVTAGATSYNVKRGTSASGPFTTVASALATNFFTDFGLPNGAVFYVVSALNSAGESANSPSVSVQLGAAVPAALAGLTATSPASGQVTLAWSPSSGATSYTITRATGLVQFAVLASGVTGTSFTDSSATDGTLYYYGVAPVNAAGAGGGGQISAIPSGTLPTGWQSQNVGSNPAGGSGYTGGTFTLYEQGYDIWSGADGLGYTYQTMAGDGMITARVLSIASTTDSYKIGVMFRNTLDANSAHAALLLTSNGGTALESRSTAGAGTGANFGSGWPVPSWVRLVRSGSTFSGYASADGATWTSLGSRSVSMNANVSVGLVVASSTSTLNTVAFDHVSVSRNVATGGTASAISQATGSEAARAFDANNATSWYNNALGGTGWLQYQFANGAASAVSDYQLTSASNNSPRDPAAWQIQGSNDGTTWSTLDSQTGQTFTARGQANLKAIAAPAAYSTYRLSISANAGGSAYGVQLAELALFAPAAAGIPLAPLPPASLSATWSAGQIALSWPAATDATSYNVKRSTTQGGPYTTISTGQSATNYTDTGRTNGTAYYYVVTAVNSGGESANSVENSATPLATPIAPAGLTATGGNSQVDLAWSPVSGATSYEVQRAQGSGGSYQALAEVASSASPAYLDTAVTNGATYFYTVSAINLGGESPVSAPASATPILPAPTALSAVSGNTQIALAWSAVAKATGYQLSRATTSGGPYTPVASPAATSYTDTGLTNGTAYYYVVSARRSAEQSQNSAQASTTPHQNFAAWQQAYFTTAQLANPALSGLDGDANGDGISNRLAYAFGASPWDNLASALPTAQVVDGYLTLTFTRRKAPADVTYTVEVTGDFATWSSGPAATTELGTTSLGPDTEQVTVRDNTSASATKRFLRVRVAN